MVAFGYQTVRAESSCRSRVSRVTSTARVARAVARTIVHPMEVVIAGGHGKVGRRLARLLVARGDRVRGLIRNPDHAEDLRADGSEPVVCDLEVAAVDEVADVVEGADA